MARSVQVMSWAGLSPREILERSTVLAVVGCSTNDWKDAHDVPRRLQQRGFRIVPVHLTAREILGEQAYPRLADVPGPIDSVVVFRPSGEADDVAAQAIEAGAKAVWLQLGLVSVDARARCQAAETGYVEDTCAKVVAARHDIRQPAAAGRYGRDTG